MRSGERAIFCGGCPVAEDCQGEIADGNVQTFDGSDLVGVEFIDTTGGRSRMVWLDASLVEKGTCLLGDIQDCESPVEGRKSWLVSILGGEAAKVCHAFPDQAEVTVVTHPASTPKRSGRR